MAGQCRSGHVDKAAEGVGRERVASQAQTKEIEIAALRILQLFEILDGMNNRSRTRGCLDFHRILRPLEIVSSTVRSAPKPGRRRRYPSPANQKPELAEQPDGICRRQPSRIDAPEPPPLVQGGDDLCKPTWQRGMHSLFRDVCRNRGEGRRDSLIQAYQVDVSRVLMLGYAMAGYRDSKAVSTGNVELRSVQGPALASAAERKRP